MTTFNKRYCSHCGTPNPALNQVCSKCGKPISSALRDTYQEPAKKTVKASRYQRPQYQDDGDDDWSGEIVMPSSSDVIVQKAPKLTVANLRDGAQIPSFDLEELPTDSQVTSRAYFKQENFD